MNYPPDFLDEIRSRAPLSTIVRRRVALKKNGREWLGLSPFQKEKTPSFYVNDQKGVYYCFSSGESGDLFSFLMKTEKIGFTEAVERLAAETGLLLPTKFTPARDEKRDVLYEILEKTQDYFIAQRKMSEKARVYLEKRQISSEACDFFKIGYAPPSWRGLCDHFSTQGVNASLIAEAGLSLKGREGAYDRFRDRVIFPILDKRGRPIAFGGRSLDPEAKAKYLNSPETRLFSKGKQLYNFANAFRIAREKEEIFVVEGYFDVVAMFEAGLSATVAPLGTALTVEQLALLWTAARAPVLCFDGDSAGRRAASRALDLALPFLSPERTLRFSFFPSGYDPDDILRKQGKEALIDLVTQPRTFLSVMVDREAEAAPLETPEDCAALEKRLDTLMTSIEDFSVRRHYRTAVRNHLHELFAFRRKSQWKDFADKKHDLRISSALKNSAVFNAATATHPREAALIMALLNHPSLLERWAETFVLLDFSHQKLQDLKDALIAYASETERVDRESVLKYLQRRNLEEALCFAQRLLVPGEAWVLAETREDLTEKVWLQAAELHRRQADEAEFSRVRNNVDLFKRNLS